MTIEQWSEYLTRSDNTRCFSCRWRASGAINSCGYALVPGHNFRTLILEKKLGHRLRPEELKLLEPEYCEFYEEQQYVNWRTRLCAGKP